MLIIWILALILHGSTPAIQIADTLWGWFSDHVLATIILIIFLA